MVASISFLLLQPILTSVAFSDNKFSKIKKEFKNGYKNTQSCDFEGAIKKFQKIRESEVAVQDYILYYLGSALRAANRCEESKMIFEELVHKFPESRWYLVAKDQVESTTECSPLLASTLTVLEIDCSSIEELTDRAECFFRNRQYRDAKAIYQNLPPTLANLKRLSQSAARSQDFQTAILANETILNKYPKSRESAAAVQNIAFLHMDAQDFEEAVPLFRKFIQKTRQTRDKKRYYERLGWANYRLGQYAQAIEALDHAWSIGKSPFSLYWKGRSLDQMGQTQKARAIFERIIEDYPRTYYAVRSVDRLDLSRTRDWWPSQSGGLQWVRRTQKMEDSMSLRKIEELMNLGLEEDARVELRRARWATRENLPVDPHQIKRHGTECQFESREPEWEDSDYRLPHANFLFSQAQKAALNPLDPFFIYSLMRQESRFREGVVSPVGAIGILQIMPKTGRKVAHENGWKNFESQALYDPMTNIELSIRYLEKLHHLMDGKWYAIAASYNAGEDVVLEWLKQRSTLTEEEFIEEIPYSETRDYVKKIYTNWIAYRAIYQSK